MFKTSLVDETYKFNSPICALYPIYGTWAYSVDPDQTSQNTVCDQGLDYLLVNMNSFENEIRMKPLQQLLFK